MGDPNRTAARLLLAAAAVLGGVAIGTPVEARESVECEQLLSAADAEALLAADRGDPLRLDEERPEPDGIACNGDREAFGDGDPLSCADFDGRDDLVAALVATNPTGYPGLAGCAQPAAPVPAPEPAAPAAPPASDGTGPPRPANRGPAVSYRDAVPAAVLARIDRCAAVAVSRRRVVATGCADGGTVRYRQPAGAPDLRRTAATRFVLPEWAAP